MKTIIASLFVIASLVGGTITGLTEINSKDKEPIDGDETTSSSGIISTDVMAIPVIKAGEIDSYLIGRFSVKTNTENAEPFAQLLKPLLDDIIMRALTQRSIDLETFNSYSAQNELSEFLLNEINARLGGGVIEEVFVTQLDMLPEENVRTPRANS